MIVLLLLLQLSLEMSFTELFMCTSHCVKHCTFMFFNLEAMLRGRYYHLFCRHESRASEKLKESLKVTKLSSGEDMIQTQIF